MRILALDLSKSSTGWAVWGPDDARAASGHWQLGSEFTCRGRVYANLHARMTDLHRVGVIDAVFLEEAVHPAKLQGHTNIESIKLAAGLGSHAESWAEAMGCRIVREVNQVTWRRRFIGSMRRGTKTPDLKEYAMQRARELGFAPRKHDEAEAIGILDYACDALGILPYWRAHNPLVQQFAGGR